MKLRTKLILSLVVIFAVALLFISLLFISNSRTTIDKQVQEHLEAVSEAVKSNINNFVDGQEDKIELIANQQSLTKDELKQMIVADDTFYDLFVIAPNGTVIVSTNPERLGLDRSDRDYFLNARNQTYVSPVYFAKVPEVWSIAVSTPFHGGVLVGSMKLEVLDKFTQNRVGMGNTGESLLVFLDGNGSLIYFSPRRFSDKKWEVLPVEQIKNRPIYAAVSQQESLFSVGSDYRGNQVLAVTEYFKDLKIGMVTKMDLDEAYLPVDNLQKLLWFLVGITILIMTIIIYILSSQISKDLIFLSTTIDQITKGNLSIQLKKSDVFEIQQLTASLNRILASLKLAILRTEVTKEEIGIGQALEAKKEAEDRYKLLYESSADAIMTLEPPTWRFTSGNPSTLKVYGVKDEKTLITLGPWDVSPLKQPNGKSSAEEAKKMIEKAMKEGSAYFNWKHRKYKGAEFPATVLLTRVKINGKDVLQATVRDLTKDNKITLVKASNKDKTLKVK
jgi:PAS domain S-box-containing protein